MSDNNVTVEQALNLLRDMQCTVEQQKAYYKVTGRDSGKALYVARSKRRLTRVDVVGFTPPQVDGLKPVNEEEARVMKMGRLRGQILPKRVSGDPLQALRAAAEYLSNGTPSLRSKRST